MSATAAYYDALLAAGQDPVLDPPVLREYMDGWDGERFLSEMHLTATTSVLELGVGTGRLAVRVAPRCGRFLGVDIAPETAKRAALHLAKLPNASAVCADFTRESFSGRFDVIYSSLTWMHIEQKAAAFARVKALLTPRGRFLLSIDKARDEEIVFGKMKIAVFPDDPEKTAELLAAAGFSLAGRYEAERAYVFIAESPCEP